MIETHDFMVTHTQPTDVHHLVENDAPLCRQNERAKTVVTRDFIAFAELDLCTHCKRLILA